MQYTTRLESVERSRTGRMASCARCFMLMLGLLVSSTSTGQVVQQPPHDVTDPRHWFPTACCGMGDCFKEAVNNVEQTPTGWKLKNTGEIIPYTAPREPHGDASAGSQLISPDGNYWRCPENADPRGRTKKVNGKYCFWPVEQGV